MAGNTSQQAIRSEAEFVLVAAEEGWDIAKPVHHAQGFDFVIRRDGTKWETVQVKTAYAGTRGRSRQPARVASLRRCNEKGQRAYKEGEFDLLFVVDEVSCWLIPWEQVKEIKSSILIDSVKYEDYRIR